MPGRAGEKKDERRRENSSLQTVERREEGGGRESNKKTKRDAGEGDIGKWPLTILSCSSTGKLSLTHPSSFSDGERA